MTDKPITGHSLIAAIKPTIVINKDIAYSDVSQFAIDSREVTKENALFASVALSRSEISERKWYRVSNPTPTHYFDHHQYIDAAVRAGARFVLCEKLPQNLNPQVMYIQVHNVIEALGDLAKKEIEKNSLTVVGVTGSSGKTTTCHAIKAVLDSFAKVEKIYTYRPTPISLPVSILNMLTTHQGDLETLVVEMPTDHYGCITRLSNISRPKIGVVLNVKDAHLNKFGTLEEIAKAKAELVQGLPENGFAILNQDDQLVNGMAAISSSKKIIRFGLTENADVRGRVVKTEAKSSIYEISYLEKTVRVAFHLIGNQGIYIALAAAAVGIAFGLELNQIAEGLERFNPMPGRMSWYVSHDKRINVYDNSAKTNTTNLRDMLSAIDNANWRGTKILVLGMFHFHEHPDPEEAIWANISRLFDHIILFQADTHQYEEKIRSATNSSSSPSIYLTHSHKETSELIIKILDQEIDPCFVSVTGHEFVSLDRIVMLIKEHYGE